ncbi:unnamed protein product [Hermetia illucens]|uniref:Uncharacterized protein n=1 Tax=Hermetia illucens TaxID=343691 RepID=A0A7R8V4S5_HERIL|nr:unnamed protein product [Hermetia illucens]
MLFSLLSIGTADANFKIFRPISGFYIENLGYVQLFRGNLGLEVNLPVKDILEDRNNLLETWDLIEVCHCTRQLTDITHCDTLLAHMKIKHDYLLQQMQELLLEDATASKLGRGLFEKELTNVNLTAADFYDETQTRYSERSFNKTSLDEIKKHTIPGIVTIAATIIILLILLQGKRMITSWRDRKR